MPIKSVLLIGKRERKHTHYTYIQREITIVSACTDFQGVRVSLNTRRRSFNLFERTKKLVIARGQGSKFVTKK